MICCNLASEKRGDNVSSSSRLKNTIFPKLFLLREIKKNTAVNIHAVKKDSKNMITDIKNTVMMMKDLFHVGLINQMTLDD